jgi:hypothetical protein
MPRATHTTTDMVDADTPQDTGVNFFGACFIAWDFSKKGRSFKGIMVKDPKVAEALSKSFATMAERLKRQQEMKMGGAASRG